MMLYLGYGIFNVGRLDKAFVETSARHDRIFEAFSFVFLDILGRLAFDTETRKSCINNVLFFVR